MAKRKTKRTNNFVASALISLGFLLILLGLFSQTQIFFRYLMTFRERPVATVSQNVPTKLSIPAQNISVNVDEGGIINGEWVVTGTAGVVLIVCGTGQTMKQAQSQVYNRIKKIIIPHMYYRYDIGERWYEDSDKLHTWGYLREV